MKFLGRTEQRKKLHRMIDKSGQTVSLVYGRRRVGKSELIKQVLRESDLPGIYYECKQTTELNNVDSLALLIAAEYNLPRPAFRSIEETLDFLFQKACRENMIFVLDEYSYLRDCVKGMDSILQALLDQYSDRSALKLILCGSYVDTMESLLYHENPLYGRVDLTINLKPMDYFESALFYLPFSEEDKVRLYSVFGGIPYYNRLIDPALTVRENIMEIIASPGARLENEVSMYLRSEISRLINANEVFDAMARGFSKYSDILSQSHVSSGPAMVDVLDKLIRMEMVEKQAPINDEHNRKRIGYRIVDNLTLFATAIPLTGMILMIIVMIRDYSASYNGIMENLKTANEYNITFKEEMEYSMYRVMIGLIDASKFDSGDIVEGETQYATVVKNPLSLIHSARYAFGRAIKRKPGSDGDIKIRGILSCLDSLEKAVSRMIGKIGRAHV